MNTLFGISMDTIMAVTLTLFLIITAVVAFLALRNRLTLTLGLRNIPRRRAQTILIIVGLMLSTVIITSAFGTGDTISYSIRHSAVNSLGYIDEVVVSARQTESGTRANFPASFTDRVRAVLAPSHNTDGITGALVGAVALQDTTTRQTKANVELLGVPADYPATFGSLTTTGGSDVSLNNLRTGQVYVNDLAQQVFGAHAGDQLKVFVLGQSLTFTVRNVLRSQDLASGGLISDRGVNVPELLLPLGSLQALLGVPGQINTIFISNTGDALSGASLSDKVAQSLQALTADPAQALAAKNLLVTPDGTRALQALQRDKSISTATKTKLTSLQAALATPGVSDNLKSLLNDPDVDSALLGLKNNPIVTPLTAAINNVAAYHVPKAKQNALTTADQVGNVFSTVFVVFGLFSIAAGIMLIFLIFVMLAAERRAEMGMARAVGTKRRHLIEQFLFEGYAYDCGAALVGVLLGIAVGLGMVSILAGLFGNFGFTILPSVTLRSVVVAFCLGALVTFLTVAFSSWRVSRLNIVAAIRDLPENFQLDRSLAAAYRRSISGITTRRGLWWRIPAYLITLVALFGLLRNPIAAVVTTVIVLALLHFWRLWGGLIGRGPLLVLAGLPLIAWGLGAKQLFPFNLGISLILVGIAMLLRWILGAAGVPDRVRNRIGFSLAGIVLVVFWLLPFDAIRSDLSWDIEMFFLSGIMLVLGGVWTVMYNSDLLLGGLLLAFGGLRSLAPMLKMAVTYPLQNRFRTGLTLAMFSLVIFTLMVMSVLTGSFGSEQFNINRDTGGYDIYGNANPLNPIPNVSAAVAANPKLRGDISAAGGIAEVPIQLEQIKHYAGSVDTKRYLAEVGDDPYLASTRFLLHDRARGYSSDAQVWQAVRTHPGYAVVDASLVKSKSNNSSGSDSFYLTGFYYEDKSFAPVRINIRDMRSGTIMPITVIGVLDTASFLGSGVYTSQRTLTAGHDQPAITGTYFFRVAPGHDVHQTMLALGSAFLPNGLDLNEAAVEYKKQVAIGVGLYNLLEGFMALGLVVGIAALGVVATRSVVERRQQIGMLRAIGFKRRMVQISFLLESSFIAVVGTALGVVLGLLLGHQLIAHFQKTDPNLPLIVPWLQIIGIVILAYLASLLTTYLPSWQAGRVYPAEALRYE